MTEPSNSADASMLGASSETAEFLGDLPNEVTLFALGHRPTAYRPLSDAEVSNLKAAVAGTLPAGLSGSVRELLKHNSAATEFVLSEQLLTVANRSVDVPARLSNRILGAATRLERSGRRPVVRAAPGGRYSPVFGSRRYGAMGAAAAALAIAVAFHGLSLEQFKGTGDSKSRKVADKRTFPSMNRPSNPKFAVAVLDDHEILRTGGTVTRGGAMPATVADTPQPPMTIDAQPPRQEAPPKPPLKFVEIDVRKGLLVSFFAADQTGKQAEENTMIARLAGALDVGDKASFIFDAAIKPTLIGDMQETLTLRVYDLTDPANSALASALRIEGPGKRFFVSM
jgi:hypothetical protein